MRLYYDDITTKRYCNMKIVFSWDENKASINFQKHRVTFAQAAKVFTDPLRLSFQDRIENGEERWQTIGLVDGQLLLLVAHTVFQEDDFGEYVEYIRIISARKADRKERQYYENGL